MRPAKNNPPASYHGDDPLHGFVRDATNLGGTPVTAYVSEAAITSIRSVAFFNGDPFRGSSVTG
jgi:hypothetical protein